MSARFVKCLTVGLLLTGSSWAIAQEDAKAILDKAAKAHGGMDKISKVKQQQSKAKGKLEIMGNPVDFTQESVVQHPSKFKEVLHLNIMGQPIDVATVYNGKEGWINANGQTMPLEGDILQAIKEA